MNPTPTLSRPRRALSAALIAASVAAAVVAIPATTASAGTTYVGATKIYTTSYTTALSFCKTSRGPNAWVRGPFDDVFGRDYFECIR